MANGNATYGSEPSSRKMSLEMTVEEGSEAQNVLRDEQYQERESKIVDDKQGSGGWWNSLSNTNFASTPTTAAFHHVENVRELGEGFISLMDDPVLSVTPNISAPSRQKVEILSEDDADDFGLGNNAHKRAQDEVPKAIEDKLPAEPVLDSTEDDGKQSKLYMWSAP